jgi:hypothetical protein
MTIESTHHLTGEPHERVCSLALRTLERAQIPVLIGGAFAFTHYTGIVRDTKDLDIFLREQDLGAALDALAAEGFATTAPFPHWLAKAQRDEVSLDIIFASGNGLGRVNDDWFRYARDGSLYGERIRIVPPEEVLCSKAFVMERERYDGGDVAHLISAQGLTLDWPRIIRRFGVHVPVLYSHVLLFAYIYSDGLGRIPSDLLEELRRRSMAVLHDRGPELVCSGPLLSRGQYLADLRMRGYADARLTTGAMSEDQIAIWTDAIDAADPHSDPEPAPTR